MPPYISVIREMERILPDYPGISRVLPVTRELPRIYPGSDAKAKKLMGVHGELTADIFLQVWNSS
jgi:hypothetical protein